MTILREQYLTRDFIHLIILIGLFVAGCALSLWYDETHITKTQNPYTQSISAPLP